MEKPGSFLISPITTFDSEEELYSTKVGIQMRSMPLHYTCHGKTKEESRERAESLVKILTNHYQTQNNDN